MSKYRKKPIVIEATQWHTGDEFEGVYYNSDEDRWWINTLEGPLRVSDGDWIITGVKGERYPCRDDIFRMTYEPV